MLLIFCGQLRSPEFSNGQMNAREFFIDPADYGLPTRDEFAAQHFLFSVGAQSAIRWFTPR
jgi:hypothetical protein